MPTSKRPRKERRAIIKMEDLIQKITEYEKGELPDSEVVELFQRLVDTGLAWKLQGSYGRMAAALIKEGMIFP
jgi:hypothetical protein|tara:strand:+ start:5704 stop:5922 length:219 start_codon:yes stop_codon:yes gene_type:complete